MRRLLHLSDLHFGRAETHVIENLLDEATALKPDLIVISGDLTQRARAHQFMAAKAFLARLPARWLAVPGNHDIPLYHFPLRFIQPLRSFRHYISKNVEPIYEDKEMIVAGLNTVTRWRWKEGRLKDRTLEHLRATCKSKKPEQLSAIFMHHPPPSGIGGLAKLLSEKPDLVLSGHLHISGAQVHRCGSVVVAAGTATSNRLRGQQNSFNVIDLGTTTENMKSISITEHVWAGKEFEMLRTQAFERLPSGWTAVEDGPRVRRPQESHV